MFAVTIDLDAYDNLPPRQLKAMLRALRFADEGGVVHATLSMLATPRMSRSTAHRELAGLADVGYIERQARPEGGFLWRIGRRFRCRAEGARSMRTPGGPRQPDVINLPEHGSPGSWNAPVKTDGNTNRFEPPDALPKEPESVPFGTPVPAVETPVPQRGTTNSRPPPAVKNLSSGSKEPSERELSLEQDEIPIGWEAAAAAERRLAGLGPVNLACEWRKLVAYSEGQRITIWRWRGWALKARGDGANSLVSEELAPRPASTCPDLGQVPGDDRQQRQARDWVRRGFWLRDGSWGPAPDMPGCQLPAGLIEWCRRERQARAA